MSKSRALQIGAGVSVLAMLGVAGAATGSSTPLADVACTGTKAEIVEVSLSSSERGEALGATRIGVLRQVVGRAAVCGTPLIVKAYSGSNDVATLWDATDAIPVKGANQRARKHNAPEAVAAVQAVLQDRLVAAAGRLTADQSDYLAWTRLAADSVGELGLDGQPVTVTVIGDGVQTGGDIDLSQPLNRAHAAELARSVPALSSLRGAKALLVGVGTVDGPPAPAGGEWLDAVRVFARDTCNSTGANCRVVSSSIYDES